MAEHIQEVVPQCPNGLFIFPEGSTRVTDADEEIMELYMSLAAAETDGSASTTRPGLGFLDASKAVLDLELELFPPASPPIQSPTRTKIRDSAPRSRIISVQLQQDLHMLKQSRGDTGSVLWRSSLHLARHLLTQQHFPSTSVTPLLDSMHLANARTLELGSGTGLLAILLGPLFTEYVASDRYENLRLVQRNFELNRQVAVGQNGGSSRGSNGKKGLSTVSDARAKVRIEEVDWVAISVERRKNGGSHIQRDAGEATADGPFDLVLAVDCIYNEALVQPLVDTFVRYCAPGGKTVVWVVVELRSSDVMTLFMETWLNDPSGPWTIIRLADDAMGTWDGGRGRWVGWVGWR